MPSNLLSDTNIIGLYWLVTEEEYNIQFSFRLIMHKFIANKKRERNWWPLLSYSFFLLDKSPNEFWKR